MVCKKCGAEFDEGNFCPICGNNEFVDEYDVDNASSNNAISNNENLWSKFANIGYIIGLITFICSFVLPIFVPVAPIAGIVFSSLGNKSALNKDKAKKGLGFSIAALIISSILSVVFSSILNIILNLPY